MKRIVVFGTGKYYKKYKNMITNCQIVALLDNSEVKIGKELDGIKIFEPKNIINLEYDYVLILSTYEKEMKEQLVSYGVAKEKIIGTWEIGKANGISCSKVYYNVQKTSNCNKKSSFLIILPTLTYSGAILATFNLGKILKKNGYSVWYLSRETGEMINDGMFSEENIVVESYIAPDNVLLWNWVTHFDCILVNTLWLYYIVNDLRDFKGKVYWWFHEGEMFYSRLDEKEIKKSFHENVFALGMGEKVIQPFENHFGNKNIINLYYGIETWKIGSHIKVGHKITFAVIGGITLIKGQDLIFDALNLLNDKENSQIEIWFIGRIENNRFGNEVIARVRETENVHYLGELTRNELEQKYKDIDVVLSTSRVDAMPIALTEAMASERMIISSDTVGTAKHIVDYENGLVFKSEDIRDLADKIRYAINQPSQCKKMGQEGKKIYDRYFSMEVFEKNILKILAE